MRVSRAELNGTQLRLEGSAVANRTITVDGVAMGTSDGAGNFRIERDPFSAPADWTVDVNNGSVAPATVTLARCTVSQASSPPALSMIRVNPKDVSSAIPSTGTATLTAVAPAGGFVVSLWSDNTAAATVPRSITAVPRDVAHCPRVPASPKMHPSRTREARKFRRPRSDA